jgi:hypothetical protein
MNLPAYAIRIILALMFLAAAGARFSSTSGSLYPYFRGESAMNYRDARNISDGGKAANLDLPTRKSNWPEGYRPARVRPVGVEYFAGAVLKVAGWLSETDPRKIARRLVVFLFSLCVWTLYSLTNKLWRSQTAGLLAAAFVAFYPPLIEATNGQVIGHTPFALVLVSLHVLALLRFAGGSRWSGAVALAVTAFLLLSAWELAPYYIGACVVVATLLYPLDQSQRRFVAVVHLIAFLAAAVVMPHAVATRLAFSWQASLLVACTVQTFAARRFPGPIRGGALVVGGCVLLALAFIPVRAGAESAGLPALQYVFYRLRFLFARPIAPSLLPESIRHLWTADHAQPSAHDLVVFFLAFLFLVPAAASAGRKALRVPPEVPAGKARLAVSVAAAAVGCFAFTVDRSAIAVAAVAAFPFVGLAARSLEYRPKWNGVLVAAGSLVVVLQLLWPTGRANPALQLAELLRVAHRDKSRVMWVSLENTDLELVRFVSTRTSTRDPFLGRPDYTAILLTFSGRTSVLLAGGRSAGFAHKHVEMIGLFYGGENELYRRCREMGVEYVLYSIDFLLDTTRYSPLYLAGLAAVPGECAAVSMHFSPETLVHFNLVYENDFYRLFRVTEEPRPIFATDHPPVYQLDILERHGDTYETFQNRIDRLMLTYSDATRAAAAGEYSEAMRGLTWCLQQAPRFTQARIAAATTLLGMGQPEEAWQALTPVLQYAPDNPSALYHAAYALAQLNETQRALEFLQLLYTVTNDKELLDRARLLQTFIEEGVPLQPGSPGLGP